MKWRFFMRKLIFMLLLLMPFMAFSITSDLLPEDSTLLVLGTGGVIWTDTILVSNSEYSLVGIALYLDSGAVAVADADTVDLVATPFFTSTADELSGITATTSSFVITKAADMVFDTLPELPAAQVWIVTLGGKATVDADDSIYVKPYLVKIPR